ncbi:MAG: hypothetical protein Q8Q96_00115 [bacterium]|nr:hypothetical protein [bacterium]
MISRLPSSPIVLRALIIFPSLFFLFFLISFLAVYTGAKNGEIERRIVNPVKQSFNNFIKTLESASPTPPPLVTYPTPTPTPKPQIQQNPPPVYYQYQPSPQYNYPTPIPGRPGSKEWEEEFWREWDERGKWIDQKNKEVEEAQKKFCEENPKLCNR